MSDFPTMSNESQDALREALSGKISKSGVIKIKAHCASCGGLVETTRAALSAGDPPVWETVKHGMSLFCPDHQPKCPGCGTHPKHLFDVYAWTGVDNGEISGLVCEDCAAALRRKIGELEDDIEEVAHLTGAGPHPDDVPSFENRGEAAWKVRNPVTRLLAA